MKRSKFTAAQIAFILRQASRWRGWMEFQREAGSAPAKETDLQVRRVRPEAAMGFDSIVAHAFEMTEVAAPLLAGLAGDPQRFNGNIRRFGFKELRLRQNLAPFRAEGRTGRNRPAIIDEHLFAEVS